MLGDVYDEYVLMSLCFRNGSILFADVFPQFSVPVFDGNFTPEPDLNDPSKVKLWFRKHVGRSAVCHDGSAISLITGDGDPLNPAKIRVQFRNS